MDEYAAISLEALQYRAQRRLEGVLVPAALTADGALSLLEMSEVSPVEFSEIQIEGVNEAKSVSTPAPKPAAPETRESRRRGFSSAQEGSFDLKMEIEEIKSAMKIRGKIESVF